MAKQKKHTKQIKETSNKPTINKVILVALPVLTIIAVLSYYYFFTYKNSVPKVTENIKGAKDSWSFELPIPDNSIKLASNRTADIQQITIQSTKTPDEIHSFYKNVLFDKDYVLESESQDDGFTTKIYVSNDRTATIMAREQTGENYSIASIEISEKK